MSSSLASSPTPAEAAQEFLRRRQARANLEHFTTYTSPGYRVDPFHADLARHLDRVVSGELKRLMVFAPPQHGKSKLTSVQLPASWLGRRPDDPVMLCSYGADLAEGMSGRAREIVEGPAYARLFPGIRPRQDSRAKHEWRLGGRGGQLVAAGVGGPITGKPAVLGIIDDPIENWAAAQSQVLRDKVWDWYRSTFRSRLWEGGAIVLIMTRWHADDLAGRLLREQPGLWTVLRYDAVAETQEERDSSNKLLGLPAGLPDPLDRAGGEPLAPSRFSVAALGAIREEVGPIVWASLYKGVPTQPEGNLFKRSWFPRFTNLGDAYRIEATQEIFHKKDCVHFAIADPAASEKKTANYTAQGYFALTPRHLPGRTNLKPRMLLLKMDRAQVRFEDVPRRIQGFYLEHRPQWVGIEGELTFAAIVRECLRLGLPVKHLSTEGKNKYIRAQSAIARCDAGQVLLPVADAWVEDFLAEVAAFTGLDDPLDDQVDVLSHACKHLTSEGSGQSFTPYVAGGMFA